MAQSIVVTLEKEVGEASAAYAKAGAGKALAREADKLDFTARRCKVAQPSSMLSESQAELIEQLREQGMDPAKMRLPAEQWFAAGEGLKVVRALAEFVYGNMNEFKQPNPILRDLKAVEAILVAAEAGGVRFHFTKKV